MSATRNENLYYDDNYEDFDHETCLLSGHIDLDSKETSIQKNINYTYGSHMPEINDDSLGITFGGPDGFPIDCDQSKFIKHYTMIETPSLANTPDKIQLFRNDFSENMLLNSYNWPKDAPPEAENIQNKKRSKHQQIVIKFQTESERPDSETERQNKLSHYK